MMVPVDQRTGLLRAATAWDVSAETLDQVNRRIHDGAPIDQLETRAQSYLTHAENLFPYAAHWNFSDVMEIGSGVGFMLEAVEHRTRHNEQRRIVGLDISESMIKKARERLAENQYVKNGIINFCAYDGIVIPQPDKAFDFIFSFATLQHIPKPFVYNLLYEIKRILRPNGYAVLHFLPFSMLADQETRFPWRSEIDQQIGRVPDTHWHHYYSREELESVMRITGFRHIDIAEGFYACIGSKSAVNDSGKKNLFHWIKRRKA